MPEHLKAIARSTARLPVHAARALIAVYQRTLSPVLPVLFGPGCGCRFTPTCSHYAAEALRTHGFFAGLCLAAWRLAKCTPLHPGGLDPVPASPRLWRTSPPVPPACMRVERVDPNACRASWGQGPEQVEGLVEYAASPRSVMLKYEVR